MKLAKRIGVKKAKVAIARKIAVFLHCIWGAFATSERTNDPRDASAVQVDPDQLQRGKRYRMPGGPRKVRKWLDNKPQVKGRFT